MVDGASEIIYQHTCPSGVLVKVGLGANAGKSMYAWRQQTEIRAADRGSGYFGDKHRLAGFLTATVRKGRASMRLRNEARWTSDVLVEAAPVRLYDPPNRHKLPGGL